MTGLLTAGLCGVALGLVFWRLGVPGGPVVGAMIGSGLYQLFASERAISPAGFDLAVQIAAGVSIGLTLNREILQIAKAAMPWAFGAAVAFLGVAVLMAFLITRYSGISLTTTLFSLAPGGIGSMGVMAQAEGGKAAIVGLFHTVRVILTFLLIPILNRWFHR
ncbi:MAG: AbrB family transcriptional regulator [Meiothermus sp.]|nr:AbrB family transcriptional regulator [Meiothermus sp.]